MPCGGKTLEKQFSTFFLAETADTQRLRKIFFVQKTKKLHNLLKDKGLRWRPRAIPLRRCGLRVYDSIPGPQPADDQRVREKSPVKSYLSLFVLDSSGTYSLKQP